MGNNGAAKRRGEEQAVEKYIRNSEAFFERNQVSDNPSEPADIIYGQKKYQIVNADFVFQKDLNTQGWSSATRNPETTFRDFVTEPIEKKRGKYGLSASGHILLIDAKIEPPDSFIMNELSKRDNGEFNIGFDEIYLVTHSRNYKIFPI